MTAFRCPECGETRWSPLGITPTAESQRCPLCGGEMVAERRQPGRRFDRVGEPERRAGDVPAAQPRPNAR